MKLSHQVNNLSWRRYRNWVQYRPRRRWRRYRRRRTRRYFTFEGKKYYWDTWRAIPQSHKDFVTRELGYYSKKAIIIDWVEYGKYRTISRS